MGGPLGGGPLPPILIKLFGGGGRPGGGLLPVGGPLGGPLGGAPLGGGPRGGAPRGGGPRGGGPLGGGLDMSVFSFTQSEQKKRISRRMKTPYQR